MPATGHITAFALVALVIIVNPRTERHFHHRPPPLAYGRRSCRAHGPSATRSANTLQVIAVAFGDRRRWLKRSVAALTALEAVRRGSTSFYLGVEDNP